MKIGIKVQPAMNVEIRDIFGPTVHTQISRKNTKKKVRTRRKIRYVKNKPEQKKRRINRFNLYKKYMIEESDDDDHKFAQFGF